MSKASPACGTCRQRKIKCDRAVPACKHCTQQGWTCPGYRQRVKFRHVNNAHASGAASAITRFRIMPTTITNQTIELQEKTIYHLTQLPGSLIGSFLPSRYYLNMLPQRIGTCQALDDAIRCVCTVSKVSHGGSETVREQQKAYNVALRSLSSAMTDIDPTKDFSPILAAILLLQSFEQITNFMAKKWMDHAGGAQTVIRLLGPAGFADEFAYEMLFSQLGRINYECFRTSVPCFLDEPAWQRQLRNMSLVMKRSLGNGSISVHDIIKYHHITVAFPRLVSHYRDHMVDQGLLAREFHSTSKRSTDVARDLKLFKSRLLGLQQSSVGNSHKTPDRLALSHKCGIAAFSVYALYMLVALDLEIQNNEEAGSGIGNTVTGWEDLVEQIRTSNAELRVQSTTAAYLQGSALAEIWQALDFVRPCNDVGERMKEACNELFDLISSYKN